MCSPKARLLFIGMWSFCDDGGVHPVSIKRLKMEVFPGDTIDDDTMRQLVSELSHAGLVTQYEVDGERFWFVTGWHRHQRIDRPTLRQPPPPPDVLNSSNARRAFDDTSPPEGTGVEGKGVEWNGPGREAQGAAAAADRVPSPNTKAVSQAEQLYVAYPRKEAKAKALKAINTALKRETFKVLLEAVQAFAMSPKASSEYCPHPATWFNEERWKDDRKEWQRSGNTPNNGNRSEQRLTGSLGAIASFVQRDGLRPSNGDAQRLETNH